MTVKAGRVVVRRERGKLVVNAMAQTPRGKQFIKASEVINAKKVTESSFKKELALAIEELLES